MTTIRELITRSLRILNVIQANEVPSSADIDLGRQAMEQMIDSWSTEQLNIYMYKPHLFPLVPSKSEYTVGVGQDWDIERPMDIVNIYLHYPSSQSLTHQPTYVDIPIEKITDEDYAAIATKYFSSGVPLKYYENGGFPVRTVTFWPIPATAMNVNVFFWEPLTSKYTLDEEIEFPPGYERALTFSLAFELAPEYGKEMPEQAALIATNAKARIRRLNTDSPIMTGDYAIASDKFPMFNYITGDTIKTNM